MMKKLTIYRYSLFAFIVFALLLMHSACGEENVPNDVDAAEIVPEGFVYIPAGTFLMGSPETELGRSETEMEEEKTIAQPFYIMKYEVTQKEWFLAFDDNPSASGPLYPSRYQCGENCPVDQITKSEAYRYANWLSVKEGLTPCYVLDGCTNDREIGRGSYCENISYRTADGLPTNDIMECIGYRIPTVVEFEYSYRAGTKSAFYNGEISDEITDPTLDKIAWYNANSDKHPHPVGLKEPNAWGIYDMAGNIAEFTFGGGPRGGYYESRASRCRAAYTGIKGAGYADSRSPQIGFRLVKPIK